MEIDRLATYSDVAGSMFGTEHLGMLLYSVVRMQRPRVIVELGTGLANCSLWMALGLKHNGLGHLWTVDDLDLFEVHPDLLPALTHRLEQTEFLLPESRISSGHGYYRQISDALDVTEEISFIHRTIELDVRDHFSDYPFSHPVDVLVSDFRHGPGDILAILGHFLPRMAPASSIFIDSAPTAVASYLLLQDIARLWNIGSVPCALQEYCAIDLATIARQTRVTIMYLTEQAKHEQNSTAWIKLEPVDIFPHPRAPMRGL